ncbi:MAG: Ku protein [Acidobacteria bacterium]|nr:Ku protein [Acidobacteriota bacterium]
MATTVWKGHVTFGLVSFPVKIFSAARSESIHFNQLHKTDSSRVKQVLYCQAEDKPIPREQIVKGYEYEKDHYVVVEDEDIKKAAPKSSRIMELQEFVKVQEVDPIYLENSYYLAPDEAGEKPYALLLEALRRTGYVALAKVTMHNREHVVVLRPGEQGIVLHTMYYPHEVRKSEEFRTDTSAVKDKEVDLAMRLVESLAAPFEPEKYKDNYRENLQAVIQAKLQGQEIVEAPAPQMAKVIDIMEALKQSLAMGKKPPVSVKEAGEAAAQEAPEAPEKPARRRSRRSS